MRSEVIEADSIDAAVERILDELKEDSSSGARTGRTNRENVIYFDGWDGLGASAVLQSVADRLSHGGGGGGGLKFQQIIHVDCTKWESRRVVQRAIAEQLGLPAHVMDMFRWQDEEDDFNGVEQGSRTEIPQVVEAMYQHIQTTTLQSRGRLLVIFQNGSDQEIDLTTFGFPLYGYSRNRLLWTFQGSLRLYPRSKVDGVLRSTATTATNVFLSASRREQDPLHLWTYLVRQEAAQVARRSRNATLHDQPALVSECFFYVLKQCCMGSHCMVDHDLSTHCANYWICDGIIQVQQQLGRQGDDDCWHWRAADAVQGEMRLDKDNWSPYSPSHLVKCAEIIPCWTSTTYQAIQMLLDLDGAIPDGGGDIFQHYDKLSVLKLSRCTFSFSSPPFLCCSNLRFLWLHHCQDSQETSEDGASAQEQGIRQCFQRLWVLDVRYTSCNRILSAGMLGFMTLLRELNVMGAMDWDIGQLQGRLPNIRKLRVTKSTVSCSTSASEEDLFSGMNKMELLDLSGNRTAMQTRISTSSNKLLETLTVADGCAGVEKISLRGCANLKNLLLSGLFEYLFILDLSGTSVKRLDLSAMTARNLHELSLDGCQELCAILWPPKDKWSIYLVKLNVDTTWSSAASLVPGEADENSMEGSTVPASAMRTSSTSLSVVHGGRAPSEFYRRISVKDTRLLMSLVPLKEYFATSYVQMEISSPTVTFSSRKDDEAVKSRKCTKQRHVQVNMEQPQCIPVYADVAATSEDHLSVQANDGDGDDAPALTWICPCPPMPSTDARQCYTYIQDHQLRNTNSLQEGEQTKTSTSITVPDIICDNTLILHVHDSLSITSIPGPTPALGSEWNRLKWCRVERCPKLEYVFASPRSGSSGVSVTIFHHLSIIWASQLPKACFVWNWSTSLAEQSFFSLELLHLDLCPRLIHVLPLPQRMVNSKGFLRFLHTLEIVWCSDLRAIFPLYTTADAVERDLQDEQQQPTSTHVCFQSLKHVHLHELPMLQGICGRRWRVSAPKLETVKIRGCWNLKRLPDVSSDRSRNRVACDCEKEWWDKLEWDGLAAYHHPSLYDPTHSRYYRKTSLRSSVLR